MQFCVHCVLFVDQTEVVALVFKPLFLCLWIVWRTVRRGIKAVWSRAGSGEATMQGMEGNLLGRGNCKTNPPQTPQKNQMLRRNSAKVRRHSLKTILPLLSVFVVRILHKCISRPCMNVLFHMLLYTSSSVVWECVNSWPRAKMYVVHTVVGRQMIACVCVCVCKFTHEQIHIVFIVVLFNLACRSVWAFCWIYVDASLLVFHIVLSDPC